MKKKLIFGLVACLLSFVIFASSLFVTFTAFAAKPEYNAGLIYGSEYSTEWKFIPVGEETYTFDKNVTAKVYRLQSTKSGLYLTYAGADADGKNVTLKTAELDENNDGQLWIFILNWLSAGTGYNLLTKATGYGDYNFGACIYYDGGSTTNICLQGANYWDASGPATIQLNGNPSATVESLAGADGTFVATIQYRWPNPYLNEEYIESSSEPTFKPYIMSSSNLEDIDLSTDERFFWDIKLAKEEGGKKYYTVYHQGTGLYLTASGTSVALDEYDANNNNQLWQFIDRSAKFGQAKGIYEISCYNTGKSINTFAGEAKPLEKEELDFSDISGIINAAGGGSCWTISSGRNLVDLYNTNVGCVINTFQFSSNGNYYLYAPVNRPITDISIPETLLMAPDETKAITLTVTPDNTTEEFEAVWSSTNTSVATVDSNGVVTSIQKGETDITVQVGAFTKTCKLTVKDRTVSGIALDRHAVSLTVGKTTKLIATLSPENITEQYQVSYSSSNESLATVDNNGVITAVKAGTVDIVCTVTADSGVYTDTCTVDIPVKGILSVSLSETKLDMIYGSETTLTYSVAPDDNTAQNIVATFTSSNSDVVSVDSNGKIIAHNIGTADITVTVNEIYTSTCKVTVKHKEVENLILNKNSLVLATGQKENLNVTILPADTTVNKAVLWTSERPAVAMVSGGVVTGIKEGKTLVWAEVGSKRIACEVTVVSTKKTVEKVTWNGTLLNKENNALRGYKVVVGNVTATTGSNGDFSISVPVGANVVTVYNADGEKLFSKAVLIEKGDNTSVSDNIIAVKGDSFEATIVATQDMGELISYKNAADAKPSKSPSTGDRVVVTILSLMSVIFLTMAIYFACLLKKGRI